MENIHNIHFLSCVKIIFTFLVGYMNYKNYTDSQTQHFSSSLSILNTTANNLVWVSSCFFLFV